MQYPLVTLTLLEAGKQKRQCAAGMDSGLSGRKAYREIESRLVGSVGITSNNESGGTMSANPPQHEMIA